MARAANVSASDRPNVGLPPSSPLTRDWMAGGAQDAKKKFIRLLAAAAAAASAAAAAAAQIR